jgi:hypothetical protein
MAEGFGRYWPSEFSNALNIARGELLEPHNSAGAGLKKGYFAAADAAKMKRLAMRSAKAATGLIRYLDSLPPRPRRPRPR